MLAFEATLTAALWVLFAAWCIWMCVVILRFAASGGSKTWQDQAPRS
jgi:hypothetical protein